MMEINNALLMRLIAIVLSSQILIEILKFFLYRKRERIDGEVRLTEAYSKLLRDQNEKIDRLESQIETLNSRMHAYIENANLVLKEKQRLEDRVKILENEIKVLEIDKSNTETRNRELEGKIAVVLKEMEKYKTER